MKGKVTLIDRPRCSMCGTIKTDEELNGFNPLAPIGQKYKAAYCRELAQCDSHEARETLYQVIDEYQDSLSRDPETK